MCREIVSRGTFCFSSIHLEYLLHGIISLSMEEKPITTGNPFDSVDIALSNDESDQKLACKPC